MSEIHEVHARLIADFSGNPAVEAEVVLKSGIIGTASCPAQENVSAGDLQTVLDSIAPELEGLDIIDQIELDRSIREAAGDADNSTLFAVSLACARAAADFLEMPLFRYLGGVRSCILPVPLFELPENLLLCPDGAGSFRNAFRVGLAAQKAAPGSAEEKVKDSGIELEKDARLVTVETLGALPVEPVQHKTVSGVLAAVEKIHRSGAAAVFLQKGSTGDDGLADLAAAVNAAFIAPGKDAQIAVCNRLLRMEEMLGDLAEYGA